MGLSKYITHVKPHLQEILGWIRSGHTEGSIARRLGITDDTWTAYKKKYSEFSDTIKEGGQLSTALVVNKLYQRAMGFDYEEVQTEVRTTDGLSVIGNERVRDKTTKTARKVTKKVLPDVGAIALILFNRDPENWKNKHEYNVSGRIASPLEDATLEQINDIIQQGQNVINAINNGAKTNPKGRSGIDKNCTTGKVKKKCKK